MSNLTQSAGQHLADMQRLTTELEREADQMQSRLDAFGREISSARAKHVSSSS